MDEANVKPSARRQEEGVPTSNQGGNGLELDAVYFRTPVPRLPGRADHMDVVRKGMVPGRSGPVTEGYHLFLEGGFVRLSTSRAPGSTFLVPLSNVIAIAIDDGE